MQGLYQEEFGNLESLARARQAAAAEGAPARRQSA
jgi:hypothetical protein